MRVLSKGIVAEVLVAFAVNAFVLRWCRHPCCRAAAAAATAARAG